MQAREAGASTEIIRHSGWKWLHKNTSSDATLVSAGVGSGGTLTVVTELGSYVLRRSLLLSMKADHYRHDEVDSYEYKGLFNPTLRLYLNDGKKFDIPSLTEETECPVNDAIVNCIMTLKWESFLSRLMKPHARTLARRKAQLTVRDAYGAVDEVAWHREVHEFFRRIVLPELPPETTDDDLDYFSRAMVPWADEVAKTFADEEELDPKFSSPVDFEAYCATRLEAAGWDANVTSTTGDQGVDVIAQKGDVRLALQCKLYTGTVGNSAVQEIIGGMAYEGATVGAVVTNAEYTKSARSLAERAGIHLLHISEIDEFAAMISGAS